MSHYRSVQKSFLPLLAFIFSCQSAIARADACDPTLVIATVRASSSNHLDWRVSELVTRENYDEVKKSLGATAVIHGVPLGGNYDDFHKNVQKAEFRYGESLDQSETRNLALTGLDGNSVEAYKACLLTKVFTSSGIHASVISETSHDLVIYLAYKVPNGPPTTSIRWTPAEIGGYRLPTDIQNAGDLMISVPRPQQTLSLVGNALGYSTSVTLSAAEPPPPPQPRFEPLQEIFVGLTPNCNRGEVAVSAGQKACSNLSIGYSVMACDKCNAIYSGVTPNKNQGMVGIRPGNFIGGDVTPIGYLFKQDPDLKDSQRLYAISGGSLPICAQYDGLVTTSASQDGCTTDPVGWTFPK